MYKDLREMLFETEKKFSDEVAFRIKYRSEIVGVKYSKFIEDIKGFGSYLLSLELKNKRVAFISNNRYEWCVTYLATATSNLICVPLDKSLPINEFDSLIERSEADVLVYDAKHKDYAESLKENENTTVKYFICMDTDFNTYVENGKNLLRRKDNKYSKVKIENDKMKFMLFTSGTTAAAKCVMLSHKNLCSNIDGITKALDVTKDDTLLSFLPAHHTFECTAGFLYPVSVGAKIAFCDGLRHLVNNMKEYEITAMISVPLLYERIYKNLWKQIEATKKETQVKVALKASEALLKVGIDMRKQLFKQVHEALGGKMRLMVSGAAAIDPVVAKGYNDFGFTMFQGYGLTETSPVVAVEKYGCVRNRSVGLPLDKCEVKINEPEADGIGELLVKGPNVMLGYYNDQEATRNVMDHGWFRTGDLAKIDSEGYVYITGRSKNVIVLKNGKNVFPEELEVLINRLDFVSESIVYGAPDKDGDVEIRAKIVYDKDQVVEKVGILQDDELENMFWEKVKEINKTMPTYKYIRKIMLSEEPLIKTTTNKVKRHEEIAKIMSTSQM